MNLRLDITLCAALAVLVGCGGSQPPIATPVAVPQSRTIAQHAGQSKSWMLPEAKRADLLYVSDDATGTVFVFSYPKGKQVGTLTGFTNPAGECVDKAGDVWVVDRGTAEVTEFSHGGTTPIALVEWTGARPLGCAVDTLTGNLAVTETGSPSHVAVYQGGQGDPTVYSSADYDNFYYCTYDGSGNLFVTGTGNVESPLAELSKGASSLVDISLNQAWVPTSVQWDGTYIAIADLKPKGRAGHRGPTTIYRVQITGSNGTLVSSVELVGRSKWRDPEYVQFWIEGKRILGPSYSPTEGNRLLDFWAYPGGGTPQKVLALASAEELLGTTVSKAR